MTSTPGIDPLTGDIHRAALMPLLESEIRRAQEEKHPLALAFLDLDHFKSINDAFGHATGDAVLRELSARIRRQVRGSDSVVRYAGDEFIVIFPGLSRSEGEAIAGRLLAAAASSPFQAPSPLSLTVSAGVASYPSDGATAEALIKCADLRLSEAKRRGRNRVVSDDVGPAEELPFDRLSRLVGRDEDMATLNRFLDSLPELKRGVCVVSGTPGSGRSAFLRKACEAARLRGFSVVNLQGSPVSPASGSAGGLESTEDAVVPHGADVIDLSRHVSEPGRRGVLVAVDDLERVDESTQETLRAMLRVPGDAVVGVVYSIDRASSPRVFPLEAPLREAVELLALPRGTLKVWLRSLLMWEPPDDFVTWLHGETHGLPGFVQQGMQFLLNRGIMEREGGGWVFHREVRAIALGERLGVRSTTPPHNLPAVLTAFVGRESELRELMGMLATARLVTIVGLGGFGKTRLARQVAAERLSSFSDGVFLFPLADLSSSDLLGSTVATTLGMVLSGGRDPVAQVVDYLRERQMLLVFDNFEHLLPHTETVVRILEGAPRVRILITSREPLGAPGEHVFELQGLRYPAPGEESDPSSDAVLLFVQSARRALPGFELVPDDAPHIARICRVVEGMPLAIELAAAWVRTLSVVDLANQIETSLDVVATTAAGVLPRHQSLRVVFDHAWSRLGEREKESLLLLSVFRGGFSRNAAEAVARVTLDMLSVLRDRSFVRRESSGRYSLHEIIRQYAAGRLAETAARQADAAAAHCGYFTSFLEAQGRVLKGPHQHSALERIGAEIDNVRQAWQWALSSRDWDRVAIMLATVQAYHQVRSTYSEALAQLEEAARVLGSPTEIVQRRLLGHVWSWQGEFTFRLGAYHDAHELMSKALDTLRETDDEEQAAIALTGLGNVALCTGQYGDAEAYYEQSLAIASRAGAPHTKAAVLNNLGHLAYRRGVHEKALQLFRDSLDIRRTLDDRFGIASSLNNLGSATLRLGREEEARTLFEESLTIRRDLGDRSGSALCLLNLGVLAGNRGLMEESYRLISESLEISRTIGDLRGQGHCLDLLGRHATQRRAYEEARAMHGRALKLRRQMGDRAGEAQSLFGLALIDQGEGNYREATETLAACRDAFEAQGDSQGLAGCLLHLAEIAIHENDQARARAELITLLSICRQVDSPVTTIEALVAVSRYLMVTGEPGTALVLLYSVVEHRHTPSSVQADAERLVAQLSASTPGTMLARARREGGASTFEDLLHRAEELIRGG